MRFSKGRRVAVSLVGVGLAVVVTLGACTASREPNETGERAACPKEAAGSELYQIASRACGRSKTVRLLTSKPLKSEPEEPKEGDLGTNANGCPGVYQGGKWVLNPTATLCFLPMAGAGNEGVYLALGAESLGSPPRAFVRRASDGRMQVYFPSVGVGGTPERVYEVLSAGSMSVEASYLVTPDTTLQPDTTARPAEIQNITASILAYREVHPDRL